MENHEFTEMIKLFRTIEKEHFKENEKWICKGKRMFMQEVVNHLKVCLKSLEKDEKRGVSVESRLETTLGAMQSMVDVYSEELKVNPRLISEDAGEET